MAATEWLAGTKTSGAKVIVPLDDLAKKYQPDFSGVADGLKYQQYYDGKLYVMVNGRTRNLDAETVAYFLWEQVWVFNKFSFGAAASILLLVIFSVLIFFGVYMLISQRRGVEGSAT